MRFTPTILAVLSLVRFGTATAIHDRRDDPDANIYPNAGTYSDWAICKGQITKSRFPTLQAPTHNGGCVRYYPGIDMTGVVTELHFYFKNGFRTACDCAAKCLEEPTSCNNWVWKHTFMPGDSGRRSCTLYSSPNLPSNVTLAYDKAHSKGFQPLSPQNNPQAGGESPLTFLDAAGTKPDKFGVSGFTAQDQNGGLYC